MNRTLAILGLAASLAAGSAFGQGVTSNEILIGYVSGFTGPTSGPVKELTAGANLYLDSVNAAGGVNGRKIRVETMDDKFDPKQSAEAARTLIKDKGVFALMLTRGTPNLEAIMPVLKETGTPMIAPSSGAAVLHDPVNPLIFNVRSKYQTESERAIMQLAGQGIKRILVIHVDDSFGRDAMAGYMKGFNASKLQPVSVLTFERSMTDLSDIAAKTIAAKPEAVVTAGSAKAIVSIVKSLRAKGSPVPVITLSNNSARAFVNDLGDSAHGVIVMQVFPNPRLLSSTLAVEMQRLAAGKPDFPLSHVAMEGYAGAKLLVEGLKRAGKNPTRQTFVAGLENMKKFDLGGGLVLGYGPNSRTGLNFAESSIVNKHGTFTQ